MNGVFIPGMEMPKRCSDCLLLGFFEGKWYCKIVNDCLESTNDQKKKCPLIPAADVREEKRGVWKRTMMKHQVGQKIYTRTCSVCNASFVRYSELPDMVTDDPNYCPHCGARMEDES